MKFLRNVCLLVLLLSVAGCVASKDTQLVEQGFQNLKENNQPSAEANFKEALDVNSENPYALLNLGVVYHNTGRVEMAREMYQKVIARNGKETAGKATKDGTQGKLLVDLAKENLANL